ncbi:MAG TPA: hypothetical protein VGW11_07330 [Solirubrobacteraceae bacterium]|nr:hypothetical protein [Solirubrobacteraceae bacterium]
MPEFCRHGRFVQNCRICSPPARDAPARSGGRSSGGTGTASTTRSSKPSRPRSGGLVVRRAARTADDGYTSELLPGVRASADAQRLADEITFAVARLEELATDPPGLYAQVAAEPDREEGTWLSLLITYLSPAGEAPFAGPAAAAGQASWASGAIPDLTDLPRGPRTSHDPARGDETLQAYRAWAARHGGQEAAFTGDADWGPQRRFARIFERLALPGLGRAGRYELLVALGRLGLYELHPGALHVDGDATTLAAKRVLGIGDRINLERRAAALAEGLDIPMAALDLALFNWAQPITERATMGSRADPDPALRELLGETLRV